MRQTYRAWGALWLGLALFALSACTAPGATPAAHLPAPSAAVIEQPTASATTRPADPSPSAAAAPPTTSETPVNQLTYFWPQYIPDGLVINAEQSWADESGFRLLLEDPSNAQRTLELYGGSGTPAAKRPPAMGSDPLSVRGQPGVTFSTGAGRSLHWDEHGQPYSLGGFFGNEDLLQVTQQLAAVDLVTWRQQLAASAGKSSGAASGQDQLTYFWPSNLPAGFEIRPAESTMDDTSFRVEVADTGSGQLSFSIVGGSTSQAAQLPTSHNRAEVTVRDQAGQAYTTGAGYSVFWIENGQPYAIIGGLGLDMALAIAEELEPVDQAAWEQRRSSQ